MNRIEFYARCREVFGLNDIPLCGGDDELEKYYQLASILIETNKKMNLTAIKDFDGVIVKHIADSLALLKYITDKDRTVADIGCGGGFPTLPCAISASYRFPFLSFTGFDSTKKKIDYVNGCARSLDLTNVNAICGRAEELAQKGEYRERFDVVSARAVSDQYILCELCLPFTKVGGRMIALKGIKGAEELKGAREHMKRLGGGNISLTEYSLRGSLTTEERSVIICEKVKNTDACYPRIYSKILADAEKAKLK